MGLRTEGNSPRLSSNPANTKSPSRSPDSSARCDAASRYRSPTPAASTSPWKSASTTEPSRDRGGPVVKVDTSELGPGDPEQEIDELPLNSQTGRNFTALMTLVPGAFRTNPVGLFDAPQGNSSFSVNGQRDGANNT